ncbi:hypothetical protein BLNAU_17837 [Blattamonas nauphoetae]|uniref:Uncharacterized protein n=1 Tax=Blattamonas nauphoetae TaxID=2049346 RepID=A0ABQ9X6H5_9EUKA|nr:hypothetical protein BLNAU_17837 [Blattamonas nauphoetae]
MTAYFTVYAASPTQYKLHTRKLPHNLSIWQDKYPFWTKWEFYAMMQCLEMTGQEHWIRAVSANTIIKLHPLVIRLLGTHGYLVDVSTLPQLPPATSASRTNARNILHGGIQLRRVSKVTKPPGMINLTQSTSRTNPLNTLPGGLQPNLDLSIPNPPERINLTQSATKQGERGSRSAPESNLLVCLNVIEVFGLSPRALSANLTILFNRISEMFGSEGVKFGAEHSALIMSSLAASHLSNQPVSEFSARLLATLTRIKAEQFIVDIEDNKIPGVLRGLKLEHKVNQELLRSHARFTLHSADPDTFPSYNCTFPKIDRRACLSSQLENGPFDSNVLYYESLYDSLTNEGQTAWTGIDSFIYFLENDSIKLFAFQITVNDDHKSIDPKLIESLKDKIMEQHAEALPNVEVEVFVAWVVEPGDVPKYIGRKKTL